MSFTNASVVEISIFWHQTIFKFILFDEKLITFVGVEWACFKDMTLQAAHVTWLVLIGTFFVAIILNSNGFAWPNFKF